MYCTAILEEALHTHSLPTLTCNRLVTVTRFWTRRTSHVHFKSVNCPHHAQRHDKKLNQSVGNRGANHFTGKAGPLGVRLCAGAVVPIGSAVAAVVVAVAASLDSIASCIREAVLAEGSLWHEQAICS